MNMMTSLDNIPLKTTSTPPNDDSEDPVVKDILNEFNQEINNQSPPPPPPSYTPPPQIPNNDYVINNCQRKPIPTQSYKTNSLYNEDYLRKTAIIIIVIALVFSPIIYNSVIDKLPISLTNIFNTYDFFIKLFLVFIIIYFLMIKNLI